MTEPKAAAPPDKGEMPFLDHLEELRWRLLKSVIALAVGIALGYAIVTNVDLIAFLKRPIDPLLPPGQRLNFISPMEPFYIALKLSLAIGLVLALPVLLYQAWAFLRPALYHRERRVILPVVFSGVVLFVAGAAAGFYLVLPLALPMLLGFATESLQPMITANSYFSLALAIVLAFGAVFEIPLVMFALVYMRLISAAFLRKHRRTFVVINAIASSVLTPGDLIVMTIIVMLPVQLFYEFSIVMAVVMERRRARAERQADEMSGAPAPGGA